MTTTEPVITKQSVGVDVAAKTLQACHTVLTIDPAKGYAQSVTHKTNRELKNTKTGIQSFVRWVKRLRKKGDIPFSIVLEATGVYHERLAYALHDAGFEVYVITPGKVSHYKQVYNFQSKTDKIDAQLLSRVAFEANQHVWQPMSAQQQKLKKLSRERGSIVKDITAARNRKHAQQKSYAPCVSTLERIDARIAFLKEQVEQVDAELEAIIEADEWLLERTQKIMTIKGLSSITAYALVAETYGFSSFHSKGQLVRYAGYDVVQRESGTSLKGKSHISKNGNSRIRQIMYMPALSASTHCAEMRALKERVVERTKIKMKGIVAVQRKLLVLAYTLFTKNKAYDPNAYKRTRAQHAKQGLSPSSAKSDQSGTTVAA